jgi:hypothetical protein
LKSSPQTSYGIAPKSKWPTRFSRIGHLLLRQDMVSRNHLAGLPCPILSVLPRIISGEDWKNNRQGTEIVFNITQNSCFVKAPG